jgi:hypothetical protein
MPQLRNPNEMPTPLWSPAAPNPPKQPGSTGFHLQAPLSPHPTKRPVQDILLRPVYARRPVPALSDYRASADSFQPVAKCNQMYRDDRNGR